MSTIVSSLSSQDPQLLPSYQTQQNHQQTKVEMRCQTITKEAQTLFKMAQLQKTSGLN